MIYLNGIQQSCYLPLFLCLLLLNHTKDFDTVFTIVQIISSGRFVIVICFESQLFCLHTEGCKDALGGGMSSSSSSSDSSNSSSSTDTSSSDSSDSEAG